MKNILFSLRKIAPALVLIFFFIPDLHAQYNAGIGIRVGGTSGVAGKYFYQPGMAVEGIMGTFGNGFSMTGLVEKYIPVYDRYNQTQGFYFYYGGGTHIAIYNGRTGGYGDFGREVAYHKNNDVGFGVDGIVGLEYRLPQNIPISFSMDLKPFVEIGSGGYVSVAPDPSIGVKFIFR